MNKTLFDGSVLRSHLSALGTGGLFARSAIYPNLDCEYAEGSGIAFNVCGCIDAPEHIPSGMTVREFAPGFNGRGGAHVVDTEPGVVARA